MPNDEESESVCGDVRNLLDEVLLARIDANFAQKIMILHKICRKTFILLKIFLQLEKNVLYLRWFYEDKSFFRFHFRVNGKELEIK